ncbi:MAG: hypothetical protein ACQEVA_06600 [Myxococcota bacterium]
MKRRHVFSCLLGICACSALLVVSCKPTPDDGADVAEDAVEGAAVAATHPAEEWRKHVCESGGAGSSSYDAGPCKRHEDGADALELDPNDPVMAEFRGIWRRVYEPYYALTGRDAELRVAPASALGATPAVICPGPVPTVFFSKKVIEDTLVEEKYPRSFLAFIAGHELGHRLNDLTCGGDKTEEASFIARYNSLQLEVLADVRAAFFVNAAGFSTRELADDKVVERFLQHEAGATEKHVGERREALKEVLATFPEYEALYQNSLTLSLSDTALLIPAARLVAWADEAMTVQRVPVPEFKFLRAMVLMRAAIPHAPWRDYFLTVSSSPLVDHVRCAPILPTHTALKDDIAPGDSLMGEPKARGAEAKRRAKRQFESAIAWLDDVERRYGANSFIASNLRSCAEFYLFEPGDAMDEHEDAVKAAGEGLPPNVEQALAANQSLFAFAEFLKGNLPPSEKDALDAWQQEVGESLDAYDEHEALAALLGEVLGREATTAEVRQVERRAATPLIAGENLPETDLSEPLGTCPDGYEKAGMVPGADEAKSTGTQYGVTYCQSSGGAARIKTLSRIRLNSTFEPKYEAVSVDIISLMPPEDASQENLEARCPQLVEKATAPDGSVVYAGACDGQDDTVVYVHDGQVQRIDVLRVEE